MQEPHPAVAKTLRKAQKSLGLYWFPTLHADKFASNFLILDNSKPFFSKPIITFKHQEHFQHFLNHFHTVTSPCYLWHFNEIFVFAVISYKIYSLTQLAVLDYIFYIIYYWNTKGVSHLKSVRRNIKCKCLTNCTSLYTSNSFIFSLRLR